jgi:hypothetical protein
VGTDFSVQRRENLEKISRMGIFHTSAITNLYLVL